MTRRVLQIPRNSTKEEIAKYKQKAKQIGIAEIELRDDIEEAVIYEEVIAEPPPEPDWKALWEQATTIEEKLDLLALKLEMKGEKNEPIHKR